MQQYAQALALVPKSPNYKNAIEPRSSPEQKAISIASSVEFAAGISLDKPELQPRQIEFWQWALAEYPEALIQHAFFEHIKRSKFFPKPAELIEILDRLVQTECAQRAARETATYLRELREARELLDADLAQQAEIRSMISQLSARMQKIPPPPDPNKRMELRERLARARAGAHTAAVSA